MFGLVINMQHFWSWVIMLVLGTGWSCFACWEQERIALLQLKANINYPYGRSLPLWVDRETADCCAWPEVKCNATTKRVIQLSLDGAREWRLRDWYFNASLFLPFKELRALHLPNNYLVGWVENEGFDRLSRLRNLEALNLTGNYFNTTTILSTLSGLSSLESLCLRSNWMVESSHLNGVERLSKLSNLKVLDLSYNNLNYSVLSFLNINDFINLKKLDISGNLFESFEPIHATEGQQRRLRNLEYLDLSHNNFNNSILSSLKDLSSLKFLSLSSNKLQGSIPLRELDALSNLKELDISENEVENFVNSEGVWRLSHIQVLHLDHVTTSNTSSLLQSLRAFPSLKTLYFRWNQLGGKISGRDLQNLSNIVELFFDESSLNQNFLQSIGKMTSLKVLSLSYCNLTGTTLPVQGWCELKNLQELYIDGNNLQGKLPSCLGKLKYLRVIDLSHNKFTGNIVSSPLSNLTSLEYLSLSNNNFQIPVSFKSFANHSNLKFIFADSNEGVVEPELHTFVPRFQLEIFTFSNCKCHPVLPNFLYYQYELRILDLSENKFRGWLPIWLADNNTRLEALYLRDCDFTGPFKLPSYPNPTIRTIYVSVNNIGGEIPANISSVFPNLRAFHMSNNFLGGNLPSSFGDMKSLEILDLSNNNLSGKVPNLLDSPCSSLFTLKYLYLDGNNFTGMIPDLSSLNLRTFDVSNNNLYGKLPRWVGNMTGLSEIDLSKNHFEGPIPEDWCKLKDLILLDLSENNLTGSIPSCLNQSGILHVHLQKNRLEGALPAVLSGLSLLVTLDLTDNSFTGTIPKWIGNLSELSILILKGNHFEGRIPNEVCQLMMLSLLDLSHNHLFGPIPRCLSMQKSNTFSPLMLANTFNPLMLDSPGVIVDSYFKSSKFGTHKDYDIYFSKTEPYQKLDVQVEFTTKWISYSYKGSVLNYMSGIDLSYNQLTDEIPTELGNLSNIHALNLSHNNLTGRIPETFSNLRQIESLDLSYNSLQGRIPPQLIELNFLASFSVAHNNLSGSTLDQKAQFSTFNESSYEGNPFLCGPPLHNNCTKTKSLPASPSALDSEIKKNNFMDMESFYVSFVVSYIVVLTGIVTVLFINPYWRKAWLHIIEVCINFSYYFFWIFKRNTHI